MSMLRMLGALPSSPNLGPCGCFGCLAVSLVEPMRQLLVIGVQMLAVRHGKKTSIKSHDSG